MEARQTLALAVVFSALGALACNRPAPDAPVDAGPPHWLTAPPPAVAPGPADASAPRHHASLVCRALALQGNASISLDGGTAPLALNDVAAGRITLLAASDTATIRLPRTGRELAFTGPAAFEPCVGTDEAWLYRGRFSGARGSGESPGAEQWIVTPFGVLRYGAAILEVAVESEDVRTSLRAGSATILPEGSTVWQSLDADQPRTTKGAALGKAGTAAAADRCAKASAAAKTVADQLLLPDASASPLFGDLAMRSNDANVLARAVCAVAKLRAAEGTRR